ncbi:nucleoside hydrolase-like domain-containing protein [Persicitalea sp.]|uniref:DUF1593 domain-containing protein n=1 Tax=Persicitalea sp. TaxID=3100273 RepID=UPI0035934C46
MRRSALYSFLLLIAFVTANGTITTAQDRTRLVVMTDIGGDPDDQQSLVRLLVHSDQFDLEGLLTSSRLEHGQDTKPELIYQQLDAYERVYENLQKHSAAFPNPNHLRSLVHAGSGDQHQFGEGQDSPASEWLIKVVDKPDSRPLWVTVWGGQRELAQALWKVKETRSKAEATNFVNKLRIHAIGNQDGHERWIVQNFPELFFMSNGFVNFGYPHVPKVREYSAYRGMYMTGDETLGSAEWIQNHVVQDHGALGAQYPADAAGKRGMKEGDSPSFLALIPNGFNVAERPDWGSFGGRFRRLNRNLYTDAVDFQDGVWNERLSVSRWRKYFQNDFAARMDWCVKGFAEANHAPKIVLNQREGTEVIEISAKAGDLITLSAEGSSDPDGDTLKYSWWNYWEAGNYPGRLPLINPESRDAEFVVPADASGIVLHLILEVTDTGVPALTAFRRIVIQVE